MSHLIILDFPISYFKDAHAQFSYNLESINFLKIRVSFYSENFKNLEIGLKIEI